MRKISAGIWGLCIAAIFLAPTALKLHAAQNQAGTGEITVGYTKSGQMITMTEDGCSGFGVSMLQSLSKYTGWTYRYVPVTEEDRIQSLKDGKIDLLCDIDAATGNREQLCISKLASGLEYGMLCARKDDYSLFFDDISGLNGKKIGIDRNDGLEPILLEYARKNNFSYQSFYFSEFEEMKNTLKRGGIDLMLTSNLRNTDGCKYVAKMGTMDLFFATDSLNAALMEQLNDAAAALKIDQPFLMGGLYDIFYGRPSEKLQGLTKPEFELIHNREPIVAACLKDNYPMEYYDEQSGECRGIYVDAMNAIARESDLRVEYIPVTDVTEAFERVKAGEYDLMLAGYNAGSVREDSAVQYTAPYLTMEYALVSRNGAAPEGSVDVVLPEGQVGENRYLESNYPDWNITLLPDTKSCLDAVERGTADATVINTILLQTIYNLNSYDTLAIVPSKTISISVSLVVGHKNTVLLQQILNKTIARIPAARFEKTIAENAINISYKPDLEDVLKQYFPHMMIVLTVVVTIFIISLMLRENHFRHLAMTDSLTGIWNGSKFRNEAEALLNKNRAETFVVVSLDIDKFKFFNNDFGTQVADNILCIFAKRIQEEFKDKALYGRDMADMFLIMLRPCSNLEERLERLMREFSFDNNGKQQSYKSSLKFGICEIAPREKQEEIAPYINCAVIARKSIKNVSGESIAYYDKTMADSMAHEMEIEKNMVEALRNDEFLIYYQPKYNLQTGAVSGAEALVRWQSPQMGFLFPDSFIPIFEKNGFIIEMDFYVYEQVCKKLAQWMREGRASMRISVNVSRAHIETGCFLKRLCALTEQYQVRREDLELELTETILGSKRANIAEFIKNCKEAGFPVSIDDFGSGYSSLNLLNKLPVDVIKIDKEFLNETQESKRSSIIVEHVVNMAREIHIETLCEGVETNEQAAFLKQIGCDMAQGYLYSKPIPVEGFEKLPTYRKVKGEE